MKFYLAPMEGLTVFSFRLAMKQYFPVPDKCFTPFIAPNQNRSMNAREYREVLPEHNRGLFVVPQILTNKAGDFLRTCQELGELGYQEVNLNLGCPSGTVSSKGKGAGFLGQVDKLEAFLEEVFDHCTLDVSIKTRLGIQDPEEFHEILALYQRYPLKELIIHPRVQKDFYRNQPRKQLFAEALESSSFPVCYNGDIFTPADLAEFQQEFPECQRVMLGRGLVANPGLLALIQGKPVRTEEIRGFHDTLFELFQEIMHEERNVLFKMKELWFYLIRLFPEGDRMGKKIRKAPNFTEYKLAVAQLFENCQMVCPKRMYFGPGQ